MKIFLSHIHEESQLAKVFKDWLEGTFPPALEAFVSSDIRDIPAGKKWLAEINGALNECKAFLVLCSPRSLARPWINFETGCAWIKEVPVIPICHSGVTRATLPSPLSEFQGLEIDHPAFVDDLLVSLSKHLSVERIPRIDKKAMSADISAAIPAAATHTPDPAPATQSTDDPALEGVLKCIADKSDRGISTEDLARLLGTAGPRMQYYIDELRAKHYVHSSTALLGVPPHHMLTPEGRRYMMQKGLL